MLAFFDSPFLQYFQSHEHVQYIWAYKPLVQIFAKLKLWGWWFSELDYFWTDHVHYCLHIFNHFQPKVKDDGQESFLNPVRRTFLMQVAQYHLANNKKKHSWCSCNRTSCNTFRWCWGHLQRHGVYLSNFRKVFVKIKKKQVYVLIAKVFLQFLIELPPQVFQLETVLMPLASG